MPSLLTVSTNDPADHAIVGRHGVEWSSNLPELVTTSSCTDDQPEPAFSIEPQTPIPIMNFETQPGQ
jgi:hypothetical protein